LSRQLSKEKMNTEKDILGYCKLILQKANFNRHIFWKEYRENIESLTISESHAFRFWVVKRFGFQGKTACRVRHLFKGLELDGNSMKK